MLPAPPAPDDLFEVFFDLSLTGGIRFAPVLDAAGGVTDFTYVRLNPAAQRMLALPGQPAESFLTRYPHARPTGVFAFYQEAYTSGETRRGEFNYQHDELDNYFHLVARRVGSQLLVSFTDTSDQSRTAVEQALRESQARERAARAEAEAERQRLHEVLMQLPAHVAVHEGPDQRFTLVNPAYQHLAAGRDLVGQPIREAWPELTMPGGILDMLDRVYHSGEPFGATEVPLLIDFERNNQPTQVYYNAFFLPLRDAQGQVAGVLDFSYDVTGQVLARQQVQRLNEQLAATNGELAATNEQLRATNEEYLGANAALTEVQQALHALNQALEARVAERTREVEAARATTERQRQQWEELFRRAPAAICIFDGPDWVYQFVNPGYQALFPGRALLGQPLLAAQPELAGQPLVATLQRVYDTGEPFEESEVLVPLARTEDGPLADVYFDLVYQARYDDAGRVDGLVTYAYDVTEQVRARRQADTMQAALLAAAQRQAQQREDLFQVFEQAPAAVLLLRGGSHRIEYVNPAYQQFFPGVALRGRLMVDAHPGIAASGTLARLDRVYQTGEPYVGEEQPTELVLTPGQPWQTRYFNFTYYPYREAGRTVGVSVFAYDVTGPVLARRAATEALARQRGELHRLFEQMPLAIVVLRGPRFIIEQANEYAAAIWGRPVAEVLGRPHFEALPDAAGQGYEELLTGVLQSGQPLVLHEVVVELARAHTGRPNKGYYDIVFKPLRDEQQVSSLAVIWTEVTARVLARQQVEQLNQELEARVLVRTQEVREAQAATERERALLQALLTQAPVAIGLFQGEELRVTTANEMMATLWGYTPAQVLGQPLLEGVPELRGQGFDDLLRQVLTTRVPITGTETPAVLLRDGALKTTYCNFVYQPLYDAAGAVLGVIDVAVEVTEQVESRRALEQLNQELESRVLARTRELSEQQQLLRQILRNVPAYIATLSGPEHRYSFFNDAYQTLSGSRAKLGLRVAEVFPEVVPQGFVALLDQVYATGRAVTGTDTPAQLLSAATGQPEQLHVDFNYQPLFNEQQQVQGILAFILDVSDKVRARRQAEEARLEVQVLNEELAAINEELRASNVLLTHTNTDLDTFVYTASHDLKAPITNIEGLLLALRQELPAAVATAAAIAPLLELMEKSTQRFLQTIGQLTDIARLKHAPHEPAEAVRLDQLLEDIRLDLAPLFASSHGQLRADFAACPTVLFPPKNLRSILYNLVSNALKYRDPTRTPVVQVRARRTAERVILDVQDNGLGLTEAQQNNLFVLFKRLHTHVEGTGVGLYMLRRIIENARGTISVRSEPGAGTTFTITLPRQ